MNVLSKCALPLASCQRRNGKGQLHNWCKMTRLQLYNHPCLPFAVTVTLQELAHQEAAELSILHPAHNLPIFKWAEDT